MDKVENLERRQSETTKKATASVLWMNGHLKTVIMGIAALVVIVVACCAKKFCSRSWWKEMSVPSVANECAEGVHRVEVGRRLHVHGGRVFYLPEVVTLIDRIVVAADGIAGDHKSGSDTRTERTPLLEPLIQKEEGTTSRSNV